MPRFNFGTIAGMCLDTKTQLHLMFPVVNTLNDEETAAYINKVREESGEDWRLPSLCELMSICKDFNAEYRQFEVHDELKEFMTQDVYVTAGPSHTQYCGWGIFPNAPFSVTEILPQKLFLVLQR